MKKIPTLFKREFVDHTVTKIFPKVTPGLEWVLNGEGLATIKWDGACCAIIGGEFYKRYDAKHGRLVPAGAIKCEEAPDPVTGHLPCWVKCDRANPGDKWFWAAYDQTRPTEDWTFEALGPHFQSNPYRLEQDILVPHGKDVIDVERSFDGIRVYLENHAIEGIVFWKDGEPRCKIKSRDFGIKWQDGVARDEMNRLLCARSCPKMTEAQKEIIRLAEYLTDEQAEATLAFAKYCFMPGKDKNKIPEIVFLSIKAGMSEEIIKAFVMDAFEISKAEYDTIMHTDSAQ